METKNKKFYVFGCPYASTTQITALLYSTNALQCTVER